MSLSVRETDDGGIQLVTVVDGANVALVTIDGGRLPGLVENAKDRGDVVKKSGGKKKGDETEEVS